MYNFLQPPSPRMHILVFRSCHAPRGRSFAGSKSPLDRGLTGAGSLVAHPLLGDDHDPRIRGAASVRHTESPTGRQRKLHAHVHVSRRAEGEVKNPIPCATNRYLRWHHLSIDVRS